MCPHGVFRPWVPWETGSGILAASHRCVVATMSSLRICCLFQRHVDFGIILKGYGFRGVLLLFQREWKSLINLKGNGRPAQGISYLGVKGDWLLDFHFVALSCRGFTYCFERIWILLSFYY